MNISSQFHSNRPSLDPNTALGTVTLRTKGGETVTQTIYPGVTGYDDPARTFVNVRTFNSGLDLAQGFATDVEGYPAQAIVQAEDGAKYVTALVTQPGGTTPINIDGGDFDSGYSELVGIHRFTPALQAVIGGTRWEDVRNAPFDNPIGKAVATNEAGEVIAVQG